MKRSLLLLLFIIVCFSPVTHSQVLTRAQIDDTIASIPSFSIHKNNYFITGVPVNEEISKQTADVKYQISFKQLLTRKTLPWDSYLFLTYTQTAFWNVYAKSSPFAEINFNPGIGLGKPLYNKDDKLVAMGYLQYEHESNGRDSIYSRSWNRLSLSFEAALNSRTTLRVKGWFPFRYKKDNPEILDYLGLGEVNLSYQLEPKKWIFDVQLQKGLKDWYGSVRAQLFYNLFKMSNQYLMLEWYNGYGESLISFKEFRSMIRIGYVIRSNNLNFFEFSSK
ncbi:phospholipase A [Zunongwangia sp. F363]|uniref:Phosphatidylcholine 1-acylhydrolase n=1 Tax=Autumnicola tepida TaxID=3075595 RepID=A0ABU3CC77_9FLAO|nr:phospholipase A [Zunongwangia sp. F363]MDT0643630.1 phospholipase A [Zunongwangia sp. F363]